MGSLSSMRKDIRDGALKDLGKLAKEELAAQMAKVDQNRNAAIRAGREELKKLRFTKESKHVVATVNGEGLLTTLRITPNLPTSVELVTEVFDTIRAAQKSADEESEDFIVDFVTQYDAGLREDIINGD